MMIVIVAWYFNVNSKSFDYFNVRKLSIWIGKRKRYGVEWNDTKICCLDYLKQDIMKWNLIDFVPSLFGKYDKETVFYFIIKILNKNMIISYQSVTFHSISYSCIILRTMWYKKSFQDQIKIFQDQNWSLLFSNKLV